MTATRPCGIVIGRYTMHETEFNNMPAVMLATLSLFSKFWPAVLFYDQGCKLLAYIRGRPGGPGDNTGIFVDKFHFSGHSRHDAFCQNHCTPHDMTNPLLFRKTRNGELEFMWLTSMAEVTNSWLTGYSSMVKVSSETWHDTLLNHMCLAHNEIFMYNMECGSPAQLTNPKWYEGRGFQLLQKWW